MVLLPFFWIKIGKSEIGKFRRDVVPLLQSLSFCLYPSLLLVAILVAFQHKIKSELVMAEW